MKTAKTEIETLAETRFIEQLMFFGKIGRQDAEAVFAFYRKAKMVTKPRMVWDRWLVKHGAYLDFGTINEAVDWVYRAAKAGQPLAKAA
jgi:hypothetical protein